MFLCVVQNHWGRGETIAEAKKNAKRQGGSLRKYVIYESTDDGVFVDQMGYISHAAGATTTEVERHGIKAD